MGKNKRARGPSFRLEFKASESASLGKVQRSNLELSGIPTTGSGAGGSGSTSSSHGSKSASADNIEMDHDCDLELLVKKACDTESLRKAINEWQSVIKFREAMFAENRKPNYEEFEELRNSRKLDSNLKKCTTFVKKIKTFTGTQLDQVEKEFLTLNLTKYLSEIATALTDARLKYSDIQNTVILFSKFHQRYREFRELTLDIYRKILMPRKSDFTPAVISKLAVDIRLFGELTLSGVFDRNDGFNVLLITVRNIVSFDKDGIQCSSPMLSFCRGLAHDIAGIIATNLKELSFKHSMDLPRSDFFPADKKTQMKSVLLDYYDNARKVLLKSHKEVQTSELKNRKLLKTKGEISDDRQNEHNELTSNRDKQYQIIKKLGCYIDTSVPDLPELAADPEADQVNNLLNILNAEHGEQTLHRIRVFEEEETRSFYQDIPDMKVYLPQIVYRDNILKTAQETAEIAEREKNLANVDEELEVAMLNVEKEEEDEFASGDKNDVLPSSEQRDDEKLEEVIKPTFKSYLDGLTNCVNSVMIDKVAKEFVDNFNTRSNRKKLIRVLFHVPRQRLDLLPLYARLVAVLAPVMPEVQLELCDLLFKDFRYLVKKKDQIFIETKLKITRFIGELVNFGMFPKSDAFQCFKILLMDFVHHQIEMACAFIETCGRYMHRNPDSHRRMQIYLEEFMRKKNLKSLEPRYSCMVDHAYFFVCPPEEGAPRKRTPTLLAYLRHLIYDELHRNNLEECIKKIRSLNWNDEKTAKYFIRVMSQPWNLQFNQYSICASLLAALVPFQSYMTTRVVDNILETIYYKIGSISARFNSRRVAMIIFLGEFYNYRLVGSNEIFSILYALISHKVVMDHNLLNPFDPPENMFRIRLCCTLLKTCGQYYSHGNSKKKLNYFLKYLQKYFWFKKSSPVWTERKRFPFTISELMEDTFAFLRPKWTVPTSYEEASEKVKELENKLKTAFFVKHEQPQAGNESDECDEQIAEDFPAPHPVLPGLPMNMNHDDYVMNQNQEPENIDLADVKITEENWQQFLPSNAELAEFDSQIERLCADTGGGRRPTKTDISVPLKTTNNDGPKTLVPGTVDFVVLTRKGNKQNLKHIAVDKNTDFVSRLNAAQEAEARERMKIKQLTLGINRRQQEEEQYEAEYTAMFKH